MYSSYGELSEIKKWGMLHMEIWSLHAVKVGVLARLSVTYLGVTVCFVGQRGVVEVVDCRTAVEL